MKASASTRALSVVGSLLVALSIVGGTDAAVAAGDDSVGDTAGTVEVVTVDQFDAMGRDAAGWSAVDPAAAKSGCSGPWSGYAGVKWTTASAKNCNIAGNKGSKKTYSWEVPNFSSGRACAQGRGYNSSGSNLWVSLGCGKGGSARVPWGKRLSYPSYKAKSLALPLGTPTLWR